MHTVWDEFDIPTKLQMVKDAGVFDYMDKTPTPFDGPQYKRAIEATDMPLTAGGWFYTLGRDEPLLEWHLRVASEFGTRVQNVQIFTHDAEGRPVTDEEVANAYLWAAELGEKYNVTPCFEVHVNMWSEHFGRVENVAKIVQSKGASFNMTLDHSHVIFKIDNPVEQNIQDMRRDVEDGTLVLDPYKKNNICQKWISANYVRHAHARPAIPNGPENIWAKDPSGAFGRGIQYPFLKTTDEEYHQPWDGEKLEPWKEVVRRLLDHHARDDDSLLATISTELIPWPDYGGGAKYSLFEHSIAVAEWIRSEWENALTSA